MIGKKILVVEDEEVTRKILRTYLAKWGYVIKEAPDGDQALEILDNEDFDLLILDIFMPQKDGWQVLQEIKSNQKTKHIPVILLNANNEDTEMFKGYELGASYYITKPFTETQLLYGVQLMFGEDFGSMNYTDDS